ncbi:gamma-glutamylcyclotransferase family protein [Thiorhodovibrio frisius]|uniref:Gamma-glutamylcyclotransferase AIG2-like domain-containing protein n=1 Tax=Thiorhodovibrio frisius TaxID=631362 RepID=H8Z666_9GAMM|nr:gamma-glutamylcyclotransferase family protein [Thiorhodovibrio frisius]EIC19633.1 hypothetical protein Thi970DRAFT_03220 [Thiorhodovibrio frisius]WPL20401.1 Gamma-glutamylcyclotransferase family protein YtfP [Thiorhodovibrio frisius]
MKVFVYGTLLKGMEKESVLAAAEFLGAATITAQLFDLGWYPGVSEGDSQVIGELYDIDQTILADVDAIEGFDEHYPAQSLFVRKTLEARSLSDGQSVNDFCYFFN